MKPFGPSFEKNLWIGPDGIVSHIHFDPAENVMAMISGTKTFAIFSPSDSKYILASDDPQKQNRFSDVDIDNPDPFKFPDFLKTNRKTCQVEAGDMLYLPTSWWHQVYNHGRNVAINFWFRDHSRLQKGFYAMKNTFLGR